MKREFDTFSPPDEYKDLNDRVIGAIGIYEEACQYAYNVYDPVKLQKALSYDEVLKNIEGKIEEADKIIKDGIEEVKLFKECIFMHSLNYFFLFARTSAYLIELQQVWQ